MTVGITFIGLPKPGGFQEAVSMAVQAAKPLETAGAQDMRVFRAMTGEAYGSLAVGMAFDSHEARGAALDAIFSNDEIVSLLARLDSEQSPYASQSTVYWTEIPIGGTGVRGPVWHGTLFRVAPGRMQEAVDTIKGGIEITRRYGGGSLRLLRLTDAGAQTGLLVTVAEYASNAARGKMWDGLAADADAAALRRPGPDSPLTMISSDVFNEIPI
jgi:hypothetical protein